MTGYNNFVQTFNIISGNYINEVLAYSKISARGVGTERESTSISIGTTKDYEPDFDLSSWSAEARGNLNGMKEYISSLGNDKMALRNVGEILDVVTYNYWIAERNMRRDGNNFQVLFQGQYMGQRSNVVWAAALWDVRSSGITQSLRASHRSSTSHSYEP
jgi:hypothetical protein